MSASFVDLAAAYDLDNVTGRCLDGLEERYLYSQDMTYRYAFARWWGSPALAHMDGWVLLNPATGDTERRRRPTLERCIARSREAGRSGVLILNLFAYRATNPKALASVSDPVGPVNDKILIELSSQVARTIVAWGGGGSLGGRSASVATSLKAPKCLGTTGQGQPRHPLYVPAATPCSRGWRRSGCPDRVPWRYPALRSGSPSEPATTGARVAAADVLNGATWHR